MEFNNKTILITGLVVASIYALFLNNEQISLAIVSGLLGYLAKDAQVIPQPISEEVQDNGSDSETA